MNDVLKEFYTSLCYYGYSEDEINKIYEFLKIKYGDLSSDEFKEVLYNAMISCSEEDSLSIDDRLIHIDGLWYASRKYAKFRSKIKDLSLDDMVKVMETALDREQGFYLSKEEAELMKIGIMTSCVLIEEAEKTLKKNSRG